MNNRVHQFLRVILYPLVLLRRNHDAYLRDRNPEKLFSLHFKRNTGRTLNIEKPSSLYDYIAYWEFRSDTSEWSRLSDKYSVREYIIGCGYGDCLPKLYGVWKKAEDVDFTLLPNAFAIKTNNASATNILVRDKTKMDEDAVRKQIKEWLAYDYGYHTCQPHYSKINPLVLAEEFLEESSPLQKDSLVDYKFMCIYGKPLYFQIMADRKANSHSFKMMLYDIECHPHPEYLSSKHEFLDNNFPMPDLLDKMVEMAAVLSSPFPFVRVDLYEVNHHIVFGEMTFTPGFSTLNYSFWEMMGARLRKLNNKN